MNKTIFFTVLLLSFIGNTAFAVDGYKDLKFGMRYEEVAAKKPCSLTINQKASDKNMKVYGCDDLKFDGKQTGAAFFFLDGQLKRVALAVGSTIPESWEVMAALVKKYGKAVNLAESTKQAQLFVQHQVELVDYKFDDETVVLRDSWDGDELKVFAIYTTKSFDADRLINIGEMQNKSKNIEKDL